VSPRTRWASPEEARKIAAHALEHLPCDECGAAPGEPCAQPGRGRSVCKPRYVARLIYQMLLARMSLDNEGMPYGDHQSG
jgi:hypothetical protein